MSHFSHGYLTEFHPPKDRAPCPGLCLDCCPVGLSALVGCLLRRGVYPLQGVDFSFSHSAQSDPKSPCRGQFRSFPLDSLSLVGDNIPT